MIFEIDEAYLKDETIIKEWGAFDKYETLTDEQLVMVLKGEDRCRSVSSGDHPEFAKLRDRLEELGFIRTDRCSWNGDRVRKTFILNRVEFAPGERFNCACAIKWVLDHKDKVI